MSDQEKTILEILIEDCGQNGFLRKEFIQRLKETGITNPLPIIRQLYERGFMRFDPNGDRKKGGVFKPLRKGYVELGMS